jgi:hypothetical protein
MLPELISLLHMLAQSSPGDSSNFQAQLFRLTAFICVLFVLWLGVLYLLYRRTIERRRRESEGAEPLPNLFVSLSQWFKGMTNPPAAPQRAAPLAAMPDLDMLTGDLPQPDLGDMLDDFALPPQPAPESADDDGLLAETFALDPDHGEESIPVQLDDMEDSDEMPAPPDSIELLRVWRDLSDGSLIIEIGGRRFTSVNELQGADLDRRFLNVVRDLTSMLRAAQQSPAPRPAATSTPAAPDTPAVPDTSAPPDDALPSMAPGTLLRQMGRVAMGHKPEPIEETPLLSIPDQIEQILQRRLAALPEYADRSIHVRPSPFGGVRIEVDAQFFEGVDEVTDEEVRGLIQDAVREWEKSQ